MINVERLPKARTKKAETTDPGSLGSSSGTPKGSKTLLCLISIAIYHVLQKDRVLSAPGRPGQCMLPAQRMSD